MKKITILVTGANGFVGRNLVAKLAQEPVFVRACCRKNNAGLDEISGRGEVKIISGLDLAHDEGWAEALNGVDAVIHCAARVHVQNQAGEDMLARFRKTNRDDTLRLAQKAVKAGVRQFLFVSSIGVNGTKTPGKPFSAGDEPEPVTPYAVSKHEAEQALLALVQNEDMAVTIVRPPMVYGHNAPGNFSRLTNWITSGVPLPLGAINNRRSFVHVGNLVDFIGSCVFHAATFNRIMLVSDCEDISTTEFVKRIARAYGKKALLLPVPKFVLEKILILAGKGSMAVQLCEDLRVDASKECEVLGWKPVFFVDDVLKKTAENQSLEHDV